MTKVKSNVIVFKKNTSIGAADAIEDRPFLEKYFVDNGDLDALCNTENPLCIVLGRTGSGKSALIDKLAKTENKVSVLDPEKLALTYLANTSSLGFYDEVGVKLDLFYSVLWRHVLIIEIIKLVFDTSTEHKVSALLESIRNMVTKKKSYDIAKKYLLDWGQRYGESTDYQVTEITKQFEDNVQTTISSSGEASIPTAVKVGAKLDRATAQKLTEVEKSELVKLAQPIVDKNQLAELAQVVEILDQTILTDKQKKYFITIDRLDERWVHERLRYQLIRALFEAVRYVNSKVSNVKVIFAIREDLLQRVFRFTRDSGDQEEKYTSLYIKMLWSRRELKQIIDTRVNSLLKDQYTNASITSVDILPAKMFKENSLDYILNRTLNTPRDVIMFFNICLKHAAGKTKLSQQIIRDAEGEYSELRLKALADEWSADFPDIAPLSLIFLKQLPNSFRLDELEESRLVSRAYEFLFTPERNEQTYTYKQVEQYADKPLDLRRELIKMFFRAGIVGLKLESHLEIYWSFKGERVVEANLRDDTSCYIHPAFWRVLGIRE